MGCYEFRDDGAEYAENYTGTPAVSHTDGVGTEQEERF